VVEQTHHDLGVDEVFGAAERDEADFGPSFDRDFLAYVIDSGGESHRVLF
jgi:hypothetical protein